eukprot:gnl/TRDRNA2_/TRDRNA2_169281_c1_seq6.p1 gnl/TRDRNA2_/TRDRNA2_169281_c1~~gnl/TRDRNA2_/TRDRNA2_169281_c1_seq6.p1  ORF type:complete len:326 (+),score=25.23 gnl/TRDRNA2_/TRDRNA2_169281_c1_seq6:70-1047(+)
MFTAFAGRRFPHLHYIASCAAIAVLAGYGSSFEHSACHSEAVVHTPEVATKKCPGIAVRSNPSTPAYLTCGEHFHEVRYGESSKLFSNNSVLLVPGMLSKDECETLMYAAEVGVAQKVGRLRPGFLKQDSFKTVQRLAAKCGFCQLERVPVNDLGADAQELSWLLLRDRLLPFLEQHLPQVAAELFGRSTDLNGLQFEFGRAGEEPAINRYTARGGFYAHADDRSITLYVLLSDEGKFSGGGTAFWRQGIEQKDVEDWNLTEDILMTPGQGTAVIFNGRTTHSGKVLESGTRHLWVASFSLYHGHRLKADHEREQCEAETRSLST